MSSTVAGPSLVEELGERLAALGRAGLARRMEPGTGIDFSSNDYLGLARDPELRRAVVRRLEEDGAAVGAAASRLLAGETVHHRRLEERLACFKGTEAALLFPSGYQANVGLLTTLAGPRDRALSDAANHASLIDGLRLARCRKVIYPHLDVEAVGRALAEPFPGGRTFLVTESLYSMDGDVAPLDVYADLAERYGAELVVDDAHATGLFGDRRGSGLAEHFGIERRAAAVVSTFGKAFGLSGAFVAGPRPVVEALVQTCRSFMFTTAPPPLLVYALDAALDVVRSRPGLRRRVLELADRLRAKLGEKDLEVVPGRGPIVPVILGDNERALAAAAALAERGFDVRAVRPPTVPPGTARLRLSVHADHTEDQIDRLAEALA